MRRLQSKNDPRLTRFAASGFTSLELIIVISIALVIVILWVPSLSKTQAIYRVSGDARSLAEDLTLAKMRAGANFTQERLNLNTSTNTYSLEQYDKTNSTWGPDGGAKYLNTGVTFGYGSISSPAGSQSTLAQSTL